MSAVPPAALVERVLAARVAHTLAAFGGSTSTDDDAQQLSARSDPLSARVRTKQKHAARGHRQVAAVTQAQPASSAAAAAVPVPPASHAPPSTVSIPLVRASWLPGLEGDSSAAAAATGNGSFLSLLLHPGTHPALASIARCSSHRARESSQLALASAVYAPLMRDHPSSAPWLSISRSASSLSPRELRAFRSHIYLSAEVQLLLRLLWQLALPKRASDELLSFSGYKSLFLRLHKRFLGGKYKPREVARQCEEAWMRDWTGSSSAGGGGSAKDAAAAGNASTAPAAAAVASPSREFSVVQGLPIQYFLQSLFDLVDRFITETGTIDVDTTTATALGADAAGAEGQTDPTQPPQLQSTEIHRGPAVASVPLGHNAVTIPLPATERYVRVLEKALREITTREPVTEDAARAEDQQLPPLFHFSLRDLPKVSMTDFNAPSSAEDDVMTPMELRSYTLSAVYSLLQHPDSEFQLAMRRPPRVTAALTTESVAAAATAAAPTAAATGSVHQPLPSASTSGDLRAQTTVAPVQVQHDQASAPSARGGVAMKRTQAETAAENEARTQTGSSAAASTTTPAAAPASQPPMAAISSSSRANSQEKASAPSSVSASVPAHRSSAATAPAVGAASVPQLQSKSPQLGPTAVKTKLQLRSSASPLKLVVNSASAPEDQDDRGYLPSDSPVAAWGGRDDEDLDAETLAAVKRNSSSSASLLAAGTESAAAAAGASPRAAAASTAATSSKPAKRLSAAGSSSQQRAGGAGSISKSKEVSSRGGSTEHTPLSSPSLTTRQLKQAQPAQPPSAGAASSAPKSPATTARGRPQQHATSAASPNAKPPAATAVAATSAIIPAVSSSSSATAATGSADTPAPAAAAESKLPADSTSASTPAQPAPAATAAAPSQPTAAVGDASVQSPRPSMHIRHTSLTASLAPKPRLRTLVSMALAASRAETAAITRGSVAAVAFGGGPSVAGAAVSSAAAVSSKSKLGTVLASRDLSTPPPPKVDHTNSLLASLRALVNLGAKSISAHLDALKRREETATTAANALVATAIPSAAVQLAPVSPAVPVPAAVAAAPASSKDGSKVVSAAPSPAGSKRGSVVGVPAAGASPKLKPAAASSAAALDLAMAPVAGAASDATSAAGDGLHVMEGTSNNEELTDLAAGVVGTGTAPDAEQIIAQARSNAAQASLDATHLALRDASESSAITADVDALLGLVSSAHEARLGGEKTNIELMIAQATALHKASNMEIERLPQFIVDAAAQVDETMAARKARVAMQTQQMKAEAAAAAAANSGSSSPRKAGGGRPRAASVIDAKSSARGAGSLAHSNSSRTNLLKLKAGGSGATTASASGETTPTAAGSSSPKRGALGGSKKGGKGAKKAATTAVAATPSTAQPPLSPAVAVDSAVSVPAASADKPASNDASAPTANASAATNANDDDDSRSTPKPDTLIAAFHVAVDGGVKFKPAEVIERQRIEDTRANTAVDQLQQQQQEEEQARAALEAEMRGDRQEEADAEISPVSEGDENEASGQGSAPGSRLASPSHATAAGSSPPLSPSSAAAARQSLVDASLSRNTWLHNQVLLGRSTRDEAREEARMEAALAAQALRIKTQQQRLSERRGREHGAQKRAARVSLSQQDGEMLRQQLAEEKAVKAEELAAEIAQKRAAVKAPRILVSAGAIGALAATHSAALSDPFLVTESSDLVPELPRKLSAGAAAPAKLAVHSAGGAHKRYTSAFENLLSVVDDDATAAAALAAARAHTAAKLRAAATMFPVAAAAASALPRPSAADSDDLFAHLETIAEPIVTSAAPPTPPLSPRSQAIEDAQNQRRVELTAEEEAAMMRGENEEEEYDAQTQQQQSRPQESQSTAAVVQPHSQPQPPLRSEDRRGQDSAGLSAAKIAPQSRTKKQPQPQPSPPARKSSPARATTKDVAATAASAGTAQLSATTKQAQSASSLKVEESVASNQASPTAVATLVPVLHIVASANPQPQPSVSGSEFQNIVTQRSSSQLQQSVAAAPSARKSNAAMHTHYHLAQEVFAEEDAIRQQQHQQQQQQQEQLQHQQEDESKQEGDSQQQQQQPHPPTRAKQPSTTMAKQYGVGRDAARSKKGKPSKLAMTLPSKQQPAAPPSEPDAVTGEQEESKQPANDEQQQELVDLETHSEAQVPSTHRQVAAAVPELSSWSALEAALTAPNVSPAEVLSLQRLLSSLRASTHASRGSILDPAATAGGKRIHPHLYSSPFALPSRRIIENRTTVPLRGRSTSPRKHDSSQSSLGDRVLSEKQLAREQAWALEEAEWEQSMIASGRAQELFEMQQARHLEQQRRTRTKLPPATKSAAAAASSNATAASAAAAVEAPSSPPKPQVRRSMLPMLAPGQMPLRGLKLHPFVSKDVAASVASLQAGEEPLASEIKGKGVPRTHQALMARSQTVFSTHAPKLALVPLLQLAPLVNSASSQALSDRRPVPPVGAHDGGGGSQSSRSSRARSRRQQQVQLASSLSKPALSARDWSVLDRIQLRAYSPPARSGIPSRAGAVALASSFREMEAQPPPSRLQSEIYSFLATPGGPTDAEPGVAPLERMPTSLPRVESEQIARRDAALMAQLSTHMTRALDAPPRLSLSARDAFDPLIVSAHLASSLDLASSARHEPMGSSLRFEPSPGGNLATPATEPEYMHLILQERVAREALARGEIGEASLAAAALAATKAAEAKGAAAAAAECEATAEEPEAQTAETRPATGESRPLSATTVAAAPFEEPQQQHPQSTQQQRSDPPTPVRARTPDAADSSSGAATEPSKPDIDAAPESSTVPPAVTVPVAVATPVRPPSRPSSQRARIVASQSSSTTLSPRSSSPSGSPKSPPRAPGSAGKSSRARAAAALAAGVSSGVVSSEGRRRGSSGHARRGSAGSVAPAATSTVGLKSSHVAPAARSTAPSAGLRPRSAADTTAAASSATAGGSGSTPRSPRSPALGSRSPMHAPRSPPSQPLAGAGSGSGSSSTADIALSAAVESILAASFASPYAGVGTPEVSASSASGAPSHSRRLSALKGSRPSSRERLSVSFNLRAE